MSWSDPEFRRVAETPGVLTDRELEVLRLRGGGVPWSVIERQLGVSSGTIGATLRRADRKVWERMREERVA